MSYDIVTRLKVMAKYCNHGYPNGAGPMGPDPTECRSCNNIREAVKHMSELEKAQADANRWRRISGKLFDALNDPEAREDAIETYLNHAFPDDDQ